jgi:hypothetical protein
MDTMAAIDLRVTKEVPLDADVEEILNNYVEIALVRLGGKRSKLPAFSKVLGINYNIYLTVLVYKPSWFRT